MYKNIKIFPYQERLPGFSVVKQVPVPVSRNVGGCKRNGKFFLYVSITKESQIFSPISPQFTFFSS